MFDNFVIKVQWNLFVMAQLFWPEYWPPQWNPNLNFLYKFGPLIQPLEIAVEINEKKANKNESIENYV